MGCVLLRLQSIRQRLTGRRDTQHKGCPRRFTVGDNLVGGRAAGAQQIWHNRIGLRGSFLFGNRLGGEAHF
jgi:hypothetical protein